MIAKLERIKNEFIEIILKERGYIGKEDITFLNKYTQFLCLKLEDIDDFNVYHTLS